ncbi:hypothetical protein ACGFNU_17890 [Spirillospora sp. NPDC048911]|uniref:hypothetical protein n=1 Tax=Spirillospora sp. NPDC048911 TaxID=3364527 RepID=UPI003723402F
MTQPVAPSTYYDPRLSFPLEVAEFGMATLVFDVPAEVAGALVPGTAFELVRTRAGAAQFILSVGDYRRTQWGSCHQLTFAILVRPADDPAGTPGLFVHRTPVDDLLTCAIGHGSMDYPVSIELIEIDYSPDLVSVSLVVGVQPTLELRIPRVPAKSLGGRLRTIAYSYRNGVPYAMPVDTDLSSAQHVDPASIGITLGSGPVADELRSLGLPKAPSSCIWGEGLTATFHEGRPVRLFPDGPSDT